MKKLNILITGLKDKKPIFIYSDENDKMIIIDTNLININDDNINFTIQSPITLEDYTDNNT
jgi:hypothetical protein